VLTKMHVSEPLESSSCGIHTEIGLRIAN
jgi:hypothetical protein